MRGFRFRRTSLLSISALQELVKGQEGELAVGRDIVNPGNYDLGGVDFLLACIVRRDDVIDTHYSHLLGRFYILDALVEDYPREFTSEEHHDDATYCLDCDDVTCVQCASDVSKATQSPRVRFADESESAGACCANRAVMTIKFSKTHLNHAHAKVKSFARKLFLVVARLQLRNDPLFRCVVACLDDVDINLRVHLRRRLLQTPDDASALSESDADVSAQVERRACDVSADDDSDAKRLSAASSSTDTSAEAQTSAASTPRSLSPTRIDDSPTHDEGDGERKYVCKLSRQMTVRGDRSPRIVSRIEPIDEDSSVNASDASDVDDVTADASVATLVRRESDASSSSSCDALASPQIDDADVIENPLALDCEHVFPVTAATSGATVELGDFHLEESSTDPTVATQTEVVRSREERSTQTDDLLLVVIDSSQPATGRLRFMREDAYDDVSRRVETRSVAVVTDHDDVDDFEHVTRAELPEAASFAKNDVDAQKEAKPAAVTSLATASTPTTVRTTERKWRYFRVMMLFAV